jgi:hypothetical protein
MKKILFTVLFSVVSFCVNGQDSVIPQKVFKRSNCILINGLFGSTKIGVGARYKSLYSINEILQLGWGVGIESYSSSIKRNFIPISFDLVGDIFTNGNTPFYMLSVGYGIALGDDPSFAEKVKGGLMVDISIGYRSKKNASQPFIAIGYRLQNASYEGNDDFGNTDKEVIYKRWSLSTGIIF